jgi:glutathionyl-hydroquinone reductase
MGMLIDGHWHRDDGPALRAGRFERPDSAFRARVGHDPRFPVEGGRYHLFVSPTCPWAHRTLILRVLKGLEDAVGLTLLAPANTDHGWRFDPAPDPLTGAAHLFELYQRADGAYTGRVTVPVLWDTHTGAIVNNESAEIVRMFNADFDAIAGHPERDYYPAAAREPIDAVNARVYADLNNGVYRAGFAQTQGAYEEAVRAVFDTLDWMEQHLARARYLAGDVLTEADWRAFPTLIRFDAVYHHLFKCNHRRLADYPAVHAYTRELYQHPGVCATVNLPATRAGYYTGMRHLNPHGIVPVGPGDAVLDFSRPHGRG